MAVNPSVVDRPPYASDSALTSAPAFSSNFVISRMFFGVFQYAKIQLFRFVVFFLLVQKVSAGRAKMQLSNEGQLFRCVSQFDE